MGDVQLHFETSALAQKHFISEKISSPEKKVEVLSRLEGQSTREAERILAESSTQPQKMVQEKLRPLGNGLYERITVVTEEELRVEKELQAILSHALPDQRASSLHAHLAKEKLAKCQTRAKKTDRPSAPDVKAHSASRVIPADVKREVTARDGNQCTYVDEKTGRRCDAKHYLQFDHKIPFALGGETTMDNLRLLCATHNRLHAEKTFGRKKMDAYRAKAGPGAHAG